ncbi:MAG TPA: hypothetical protein ENK05_01395 [Gammaproteobacteria bacterium]|nr:hypothetical protein [Gammaproteobacteria bacterium]
MHTANHKHRRLIHWLLVLALALAPLQGATAALYHGCQNGQHSMPMQQKCHHMQVSADDTSLPDCCKHDCDGQSCSGNCHLAHGVSFLAPVPPLLGTPGDTPFEPTLLTARIGRVASSLFRPPRLPL